LDDGPLPSVQEVNQKKEDIDRMWKTILSSPPPGSFVEATSVPPDEEEIIPAFVDCKIIEDVD